MWYVQGERGAFSIKMWLAKRWFAGSIHNVLSVQYAPFHFLICTYFSPSHSLSVRGCERHSILTLHIHASMMVSMPWEPDVILPSSFFSMDPVLILWIIVAAFVTLLLFLVTLCRQWTTTSYLRILLLACLYIFFLYAMNQTRTPPCFVIIVIIVSPQILL
jgi:hypothetical protein